MKHIHAELMKAWLDDTSQYIETYIPLDDIWATVPPGCLLSDNGGLFRLRKADKYAELKQAQKDGKRIAFYGDEGVWDDYTGNGFYWGVDRYKIIPYDQTEKIMLDSVKFGPVNLTITKSELTGKISVEVIDE